MPLILLQTETSTKKNKKKKLYLRRFPYPSRYLDLALDSKLREEETERIVLYKGGNNLQWILASVPLEPC